ncbi:hypothetical protein BDV38DRAFT_280014 [Aspergillus pseudotamarii]|uniref:Up-regulated in Daf-2 domain-containing protein n=1 Tax=Aspergillus pseudotamarii TaxID=132259 RepID=A0A5N6T2I1_ASPPS|nr:uncharacterized protein BDV38DRAFT_280014 [Aspergillus pseudotamarii]KAE8140515.1 hypothetical protein BDV38DRAFT_280014 [Aspergillus pseudotamarii]
MTHRQAYASVRNGTSRPIYMVGWAWDHRVRLVEGFLSHSKIKTPRRHFTIQTQRIFRPVEYLAPNVIPDIATSVAIAAAGDRPGARSVAAVTAVALASKPLTERFVGTESTSGSKQHILREEDRNATTENTIHEDGPITIKSNSGIPETVSSKRTTS